ncbi:sensor histidine kinase [Microbacterium luticocti]|uniref:sensor histidine kinase n=1 Tax=Microbacterium luticocti TaxID=451764 RepID=UPI0003FF7053|nr:histidine kinase [Microbacterium luticocti]
MPTTADRSPRVDDAGLRLPRPPGVIRRFWDRHPVLSDVLIALVSAALSFGGFASARTTVGSLPQTSPPAWVVAGIVVLMLGTCTALLFRRHAPLVGFVLSVALQLTAIVVPHGAAVPLLVVSTYALAVYRSTRWCTIAAVTGTAAVTGISLVVLAMTDPGAALPASINTMVNTGFSVLVGALVGVNVGNRRRWIAAVLDRSRQLVAERDQQAELAAAAERARIAREMHDIVAHSLTVIVALTEGAGATDDVVRAREATDAAAATARQALGEMRAMLGVLRTDETSTPLAPVAVADPHEVVATAQRAGFPVTLTVTGTPQLPAAVAFAVGRIVQEGVTNAMRHAPGATRIAVQIAYLPEGVSVRIENDGLRVASAPPGYGLRGLAERAAHLGGTLHGGPADGRWVLHAHLPMTSTDPEPR